MSVMDVHQHNIRVYAEDVDFMGIVYHANYLFYLERSRTEMLRHNNLLLPDFMKSDVFFAIHEIGVKYLFPARLDDLLTIVTEMTDVKGCSFSFNQKIENQHQQLVCDAKVRVVCVDGALKPKRFPKTI